MDMQGRLDRLERRCRLQAWALGGLAAVGLLAGAYRGEIVRCSQLVVVDDRGRERIVMGAGEDVALVSCFDGEGVSRASLAAGQGGEALIRVAGPGKAAAALSATKEGKVTVDIYNQDGKLVSRRP